MSEKTIYTTEQVLRVEKYTRQLMAFSITRPKDYAVIAVQFLSIGLPEVNGFIWRSYSIVSNEKEDFLEYYAELIEGGAVSLCLAGLKAEYEVFLDTTALGYLSSQRFTYSKDLVMLSTALFLSQLKQVFLWQQFDRVVLVYSVRHKNELISLELVSVFKKLSKSCAVARAFAIYPSHY